MIDRVKATLRPFGWYRAARFGWHYLRDPIFRRDHRLARRQPENLFQFRTVTAPNRYPRLFAYLREHVTAPHARVLSFGCATGEEVFSLRRYLPAATIKGLDINPANIATCASRLAVAPDAGLAFAVGSSAATETPESYDAVLALAVFQHPDLKLDRRVATCAPRIRFVDFERVVAGLAAGVKPGGYLALRHTAFRFADTACSRDFTLRLELPTEVAFFPRFDRDDRRIADAATEQVVFQKNLR